LVHFLKASPVGIVYRSSLNTGSIRQERGEDREEERNKPRRGETKDD
jgi:hypothetical protein